MMFREVKDYGNDEPQPKKLCTEGDELIKRMTSKQTEKYVDLTKAFGEDNRFVTSHFEPITNDRKGTNCAADLEDHCKHLELLEQLKSAGLSSSDIQFYIDYKMDRKGYKNVEKTVLQERMNRINSQIKNDQNKNTNADEAKDICQNVLLIDKPNSTSTQLEFSLKNEKPKERSSHPIDNIKSLETNLFSHLLENTNIRGLRNKTRKLNNRISKLQCQLESYACPPNLEVNRKTNWDVCTPDQINPGRCVKSDANKVYTCTPSNYYTVRNGEIIKLNNANRIPVQTSQEKLSIENIKKLPKYSNYEIGTPTKIIYLQNLSNNITENDLKTIFKLFEENITSFKLLTGRLKGRAFITFNDEISCAAAFQKLNGHFVNNKPMIFEYGKKTS